MVTTDGSIGMSPLVLDSLVRKIVYNHYHDHVFIILQFSYWKKFKLEALTDNILWRQRCSIMLLTGQFRASQSLERYPCCSHTVKVRTVAKCHQRNRLHLDRMGSVLKWPSQTQCATKMCQKETPVEHCTT